MRREEAEQSREWQRKIERHYVGPKRQDKVAMQVFVEPQVREGVKALAKTEDMGAQEFVEKLIVKVVNENHDRVEEGLKLLARRDEKKPYRTKLQMLEEQNARLQEVLEAATTPRHK